MTKPAITTEFLPAERATRARLEAQQQGVVRSPLLSFLLDAVAEAVVILNDRRQIVYANAAFLRLAGPAGRVIGLRPGEALRCVRVPDSPGGCGTTRFCRACGASQAIVGALSGHRRVEECRIIREEDAPQGAMDLRVMATPFGLGDEEYVIFALTDVASEKRRLVLERIFLHDVGNTASIIHGATDMMVDLRPQTPEPMPELLDLLNTASRRLLDEIRGQRELTEAEQGELQPHPAPLRTRALLEEVIATFQSDGRKGERRLVLDPAAADLGLISDPTLLGRVLMNMVKNALEATPPGRSVTLSCRQKGSAVEFAVHNPGVMPEAVQLQVFQRSFSTKGQGRGLGTYGMRLLTERYLGGWVSFTSTAAAGTTFRALLPSSWQSNGPL